MGEERVVALDRHHRLARHQAVALVQGVHDELVPAGHPLAIHVAPGTELEDRERLVDPAQDRLALLEDLHRDVRVLALVLEQLLGEHEVGVGVVPVADALDRQPEDVGVQPRGDRRGHGASLLRQMGCEFLPGRPARPRLPISVPRPVGERRRRPGGRGCARALRHPPHRLGDRARARAGGAGTAADRARAARRGDRRPARAPADHARLRRGSGGAACRARGADRPWRREHRDAGRDRGAVRRRPGVLSARLQRPAPADDRRATAATGPRRCRRPPRTSRS